jgi:hypothetical protein
VLQHVEVEEPLIFGLRVREALEHYGDEEVQEDQVHKDVEAEKVEDTQLPRPAPHRLIACLNIVVISWVLHAIEHDFLGLYFGLHYRTPRVGCCYSA